MYYDSPINVFAGPVTAPNLVSLLTANRTLWVRTDGSDANDGSANDAGHAFLTIQHAQNVGALLDKRGYGVLIRLGNTGSYGDVALGSVETTQFDTWTIEILGDTANPSGYYVNSIYGFETTFRVSGVTCPYIGNEGGYLGIASSILTLVESYEYRHTGIDASNTFADDSYTAVYSRNGFTVVQAVSISGTPAYLDGFVYAEGSGQILLSGTPTGAATGPRYYAATDGQINMPNEASATALPGSTAGTLTSGGRFTWIGGSLCGVGELTGTPTAPTAAAGTSTTQIATTAFVDTSYAPKASPTLTGTPLAPTAASGTNNTQIATTAFVHGAVADLVGSVPSTLDTLDELAAALGDDPNFATTIATALGLKEVASNKDASGGYAGLTLFKINFKNAANTFTSFFTNTNTAARTYTFPDRSITVAGTDEIQPVDATLTALAGQNWVANSVPIGSGADTVAQINFAANTFPARSSAGNLVAKTITDAALTVLDDTTTANMLTTLGAQPLDATLTALAAADWSGNSLPIGSGVNTVAQVTFAANTFPARASTGNLVAKTLSDFALTLLDDADATAARVTLGVGTGTSGDMAGPTVSVDGEIPVFNGITGKVLKQSAGTDFSFDGHTLRVGSGGGLSAAVLTTLNAGVSLVLDDQGASGVGIWLKGNGATTPNKYIATTGGVFRILNDAASVEILRLTDAGAVTFPGTVTSNGGMVLTLAGNLSTTGAFNTSFTQRGSFTHTLPGATSVIPGIQSSVVIIKQPTPTSKAANSTLTAAEVLVGGAQYTGNTGTLTTPTGTLLDAAVTMSADEAFDFFVVNTGSGTCTLTMAASGMTAVGTMTVASNTSQNFRFRKTAGNAFTVYRA